MTGLTVDDDAEARLDDPAALLAADPGAMLRAIATSAAQVRAGATAAAEADLDRWAESGRPRAVVVAGMGGSGIAGDVLAAVAGPQCPAPVVAVRGYELPGWVGAADAVLAVSCSGSTEETLAVAEEAARRGCRLLGVGAADSPLADLAAHASAPYVAVDAAGRLPRSVMWLLSLPLLLAAEQVGLLRLPPDAVAAAATRLEVLAGSCHPDRETFVNPAKTLAVELSGTLPLVWGSGQVGAVAAYRTACQLNENAKWPAVSGALPEAHHNQVVAFDGPYAGGEPGGAEDFFRDRVDDPDPVGRLRLLLLRDRVEHPQVARRAEVSAELAADRGVPVTVLRAEGEHPLERLASLVGLVDHATAYLALLHGIDPTPIDAISTLKARIAAPEPPAAG